MREMQMPSGSAPQFLVLGELQRRKRMRDDFKRREAADMPTVAEEMITGRSATRRSNGNGRCYGSEDKRGTGHRLAQAMPMQPTRAPQPQMAASGG